MGNSASRRRAATQRQRQIRTKAQELPAEGPPPRFVADVMLGRLAKWLRIAGFDVLYSNRYTDDELVSLSREEGRVLLSRDTRLLVRRAVQRFIYLENDAIREQLRQVLNSTGTHSLPGVLSRCLHCNQRLERVAREQVRERVPPFVFATQAQFQRCAACEKIYWAGTHRQAVLKILASLLRE
ncbi:MAG: hypothetical protein FJW35_15180 [Acidobacteria bacterium]|nr:hypothetical protein [Acidobacteriota bacterium]